MINLEKSQQISKISTNLENLDSLDENLDAAKCRLKSLYLKNLNKKKNCGLDTKDSLHLDLAWYRLSRPPGLEKTHFGLTEIWSSSPFACKFNTFYLKNCCFTKPIKKQKTHIFLRTGFFLRKSFFINKELKFFVLNAWKLF